jgi:tetratricopeptide (TPR) repeat protein
MAAVIWLSPAPEKSTAGQELSARTLSGDELVRIGEIHDVQNHYPEALTYYSEALESFRVRKQRKGEAVVLTKIGLIFERQGRREEAAVQFRQALALFSKTADSPVHADALFGAGRVSLWLGAREQAATLFQRAKERYRRAQNVQALESVTVQSGLLKVSDGTPEEGLHELQQVVEDAGARHDQERTLTALMALGDAHWILDRADAAGTHYQQSLALLQQRPQASIEARLRIRLAALNGMRGREEEGIQFAKRAVTLSQSLGDTSGEAAAWALLGSLHEALGHDSEMEEAFRRALAIYRKQPVSVHAIRSGSSPTPTSRGEFR